MLSRSTIEGSQEPKPCNFFSIENVPAIRSYIEEERIMRMTTWNQQSLHKHMAVYSSDNRKVGHVSEIYEDSFMVREGFLFHKARYIPYNAITQVDKDDVILKMTADEAANMEWEKRPDYEHHLGDPTQLFYDRGHGIEDPFDDVDSHS